MDKNGEETHLRVYMMVRQQHFFADVFLKDGTTELKEASLFQDMSVLGVEPKDEDDQQTPARQNVLTNLIEEQIGKGNWLFFPGSDKRLVVVAFQEDPEDKYYMVYDLQRANYTRRIEKKQMADEAAAINDKGTIMVFVEDEKLAIRTIRVPNSSVLVNRLRPRFAVAETKINPAQASNNRQ